MGFGFLYQFFRLGNIDIRLQRNSWLDRDGGELNFPSTNSNRPSARLSYELKAKPARSTTTMYVVIRQTFAEATNKSSGDQISL